MLILPLYPVQALDAAKYGVMREGQETGIRLLNYRFYPEKEVSA